MNFLLGSGKWVAVSKVMGKDFCCIDFSCSCWVDLTYGVRRFVFGLEVGRGLQENGFMRMCVRVGRRRAVTGRVIRRGCKW